MDLTDYSDYTRLNIKKDRHAVDPFYIYRRPMRLSFLFRRREGKLNRLRSRISKRERYRLRLIVGRSRNRQPGGFRRGQSVTGRGDAGVGRSVRVLFRIG